MKKKKERKKEKEREKRERREEKRKKRRKKHKKRVSKPLEVIGQLGASRLPLANSAQTAGNPGGFAARIRLVVQWPSARTPYPVC